MGKYSAARDLDLSIKDRWYLVANRSDAVIYRDRRGRPFEFVERFLNPSARLTESELVSDRPGRTFSSVRGSSVHNSLDQRYIHHERSAELFAKKLAGVLDRALHEERFSELVVVAEPHFLGLLRSKFTAPVSRKVYRDIPREFAQGSDEDLQAFILSWLER